MSVVCCFFGGRGFPPLDKFIMNMVRLTKDNERLGAKMGS